ncbi:MAG: hypothetical protein ACLFVU_02805 [Phycisphaerae bacterium]
MSPEQIMNQMNDNAPGDDPFAPDPAEQNSAQHRGSAKASKKSIPDLKALAQGNVTLVVVFLAGLAVVYLLSLRGGPSAATAQAKANQLRVDAALSVIGQVTVDDKKAVDVVKSFHSDASQRQIPVGSLVHNPFKFAAPKKIVKKQPDRTTEPVAPVGPSDDEVQARQNALRAVRSLDLQSILVGSERRTAMIDNSLLQVGQTVKGWTIVRIEEKKCVLKWQDLTRELILP